MKNNRQFWAYFTIAIALTLLFSEATQAHVLTGETVGFWYGMSHPIGGLDHILAMVAVGLWAVQIGGRAVWFVPLTFVSVMVLGGFLGMVNVSLPFVEQGIVASDFIMGGLILISARFPLAVSATIVGLLAIFHGYAHGAEMPETASGLTYGAGFAVATSCLHLLGISIGVLVSRFDRLLKDRIFRLGGIGIIIGACYLLFGS
jgi:urease accessory protein